MKVTRRTKVARSMKVAPGMKLTPIVLAAVLYGAASGLAGTAVAGEATEDSVTGSTISPFFQRVEFDAHSGPSGEDPRGTVNFFGGGDFTFGGPVTCLDVRGNVATFNIDTIFGIVSVEVTDGAATGAPDVIRTPSAAIRAPGDCAPFGPFDGMVTDPVTSGDLRIVDASPPPPTPTGVDQCKKGGHVRFGFRNQGQCVAFVRHAG
jgi:hypothetical protein